MKKPVSTILALSLMLAMAAGCGGTGTPPAAAGTPGTPTPAQTQYISMGTGGVTGVYYPLGGAMASLISNNISGYNCTAESTGGAVENAKLIASGGLEMGFVAASTLYDAQNGLNAFEGAKADNILGVFSFYPEVVQIVCTDTSLRTIPDLMGKRVAIGASGSGTAVMCQDVLQVYDMTLDDIKGDYLGFGDAVDGLKDGHIDAAFTWAGVPTANIMDLSAQHDISLITFTDADLVKLQEKFPYAVPANITQEVYPALAADAQTFSIPATIACTADLPEEFVYDFLVTIFENSDVLAQTHERGGDLSLETALDGYNGIKLHPGAEKFFQEKGLLP